MITNASLQQLSPEAFNAWLSSLTTEEAAGIRYDWDFWARPDQLKPHDDMTTWLALAGRGWGKTRVGAQTTIAEVRAGRARRIALIAETAADARDVIVEGESGILACSPPWFKPKYEPSKRRLTWPNGAVATTYNATEPDQLRGPQFDFAWGDELCFIAGTMIQTERGEVAIENVKVGDRVWTREGLRRVAAAGLTKRNAELWTNGYVTGTYGHPVWTTEGFMRLTDLLIGDTVAVWQNMFCITDANIGVGAAIIKTVADACYPESCGKMPTGQSRKGMRFTTETKIPIITNSAISSSSLGANTSNCTSREDTPGQVSSGGVTTLSLMCGESGRFKSINAPNVAIISDPTVWSSSTVMPIVELAQIVVSERLDRRADVYNLEVEGCNEYFANGLLVHNCKWAYAQETYDNLQFGLRLGANPWQMFTTTPRPIPIVRDLLLDDIELGGDTKVTRGNTLDNAANLAPKFLTKIIKKYEGTRLGRQELHAELLDDTPGALWSRATCETAFRRDLPPMKRIVLAIDPSGTSGDDDGDDIGMVVCGLDEADKGWVMADLTGQYGPGQWGALAVATYHKFQCDLIVGEKNFGGAMVEYTVRSVDPNVPYKAVNASRGKRLRAEPVAALYDQNRVYHHGAMAALEDQMCLMTRDGYVGRGSPDRLDAMVWGITELMLAPRERDMVF